MHRRGHQWFASPPQPVDCPLVPQYWLGASDLAAEGTWAWDDKTAWSYTNWRWGEPDGDTNQNCLGIWTAQGDAGNDGKWGDFPCHAEGPFVCTDPPGRGQEGFAGQCRFVLLDVCLRPLEACMHGPRLPIMLLV